jgi:hypothetical protein
MVVYTSVYLPMLALLVAGLFVGGLEAKERGCRRNGLPTRHFCNAIRPNFALAPTSVGSLQQQEFN